MMQALQTDKWNVLVVDDDELIHDMTKINLGDLGYDGKGLSLLHAYTAREAQKILCDNKNISIIILDVMMETDNAGLNLVKFVRDEIKNHDVRILLHTGQPGIAPKREVSEQYDIDGYLDKNVADNDDCYVAVKLAIRSFQERIKLKLDAENNDEFLLEEITGFFIELLTPSFVVLSDYEVTRKLVKEMVFRSQRLLAGYALNDMKDGLTQGATKLARSSKHDYYTLLQLNDIKTIVNKTTLKDYKEEYMGIASMLLQIAKRLSEHPLLPKTAKKKLVERIESFSMANICEEE